MRTGVWITTDIPEAEVDNVIAGYRLDDPQDVKKKRQENSDLWTVTATFGGDGRTVVTHGDNG